MSFSFFSLNDNDYFPAKRKRLKLGFKLKPDRYIHFIDLKTSPKKMENIEKQPRC